MVAKVIELTSNIRFEIFKIYQDIFHIFLSYYIVSKKIFIYPLVN